jgi:hypothetical protein
VRALLTFVEIRLQFASFLVRPLGIVEGVSARIGIFAIHKDFPSSRCPHDTDSIPIGRFARFIRQFVPKHGSVHRVKGVASMFPWKPDHVALKKLLIVLRGSPRCFRGNRITSPSRSS